MHAELIADGSNVTISMVHLPAVDAVDRAALGRSVVAAARSKLGARTRRRTMERRVLAGSDRSGAVQLVPFS
ncbi:hypothetical protein BH23ACT3_BH23ACT3_10830 [soil metagenome]